ncbi:ABC transporter, ATP-binding protein [Ancylostoma ceylanicum]|uniref:ABC transporter, ATP-binding protein n=1 Tax=Ancylostoma ceylanicum TaxID=53326 RepID=A0A0D6LMK9_9BILA|nr:ABC transporter, ATP-binding protein [Ancylostoma ceylanicum]
MDGDRGYSAYDWQKCESQKETRTTKRRADLEMKRKACRCQKYATVLVSGVALPREVLAIMGSSGAGKTTLMNILAFQSSKEVESNGAVLVNGKAMTKYEMRRMSAYVQQIDLFCGTLTVKEQLMYSALLRMGNKFSYKEKMEKVEEAIKDMNLFECQDSIIGIPNRKKGISVGEKKRLAFASEILTDPAILFCDEPTSGLDAFMAHQVVTALRVMADKGKTVVTVIHQPGSQIFMMFHRVCFMALGKTAYHGTVKDLIKFFASLGDPTLRVPESYNPADHVIAKLSVSKDTTDEDVERVEVVLFITAMFHESIMGDELRELIWAGSAKFESCKEEENERRKHRYAVSIWMQMNVLFRRAFLTTIRDPVLLQVRILQVVMPQYIALPLIYSVILYWMTGLAATARQFAIFSLANVFQSLNAISIGYASGCVFGDEGLAITAMSGFMQAMLVFGGFYINLHNIPMWMRPFSALSFFKYSFEALQINQWTDVTYIRGCTGLLSAGNNTVYCPSETGKETDVVAGLIVFANDRDRLVGTTFGTQRHFLHQGSVDNDPL